MEFIKSGPLSNVALIIPQKNTRITYGDLVENVKHVTSILTTYSPGRTIGIMMPNCAEFVVGFLSIVEARHIALPLNPNSTSFELKQLLDDLNVGIIITLKDQKLELFKQLQLMIVALSIGEKSLIFPGKEQFPCDDSALDAPDGTCLVLPTSGTTSMPKIVPLTQSSLLYSARKLATAYQLDPKDCLLLVMPLFHVHGLIGNLLTTLISGGRIVLPLKFSASNFIRWAADFEVSWISAVPTIYQILLMQPKKYLPEVEIQKFKKSLKFVRSCSAGLPFELVKRLQECFEVPVIQAYGMTEAAHLVATGRPNGIACPANSVGAPLGREVKLVDGEICLKGEGVMERYLRPSKANEKAFTDDGFFRTGDLGHFDDQGNLYIDGRIKELINRGGEKINPLEVEGVILSSGLLNEAVVFPIKDFVYGEVVACVAVPKAEDHRADLKERIQEYCRQHLSDFKCPSEIIVTDEIPKTSVGKVQRIALSRKFGELQI